MKPRWGNEALVAEDFQSAGSARAFRHAVMSALLRAGNPMQSVPLREHVVHLLEDRLQRPPFPRRENIDLALELQIEVAGELQLALTRRSARGTRRRLGVRRGECLARGGPSAFAGGMLC